MDMNYKKLRLIEKELFIFKGTRAYGIRDEGGYLMFFPYISMYTNQLDRFKREIKEQHELADTIMRVLKDDFPMCLVCNEIVCECPK